LHHNRGKGLSIQEKRRPLFGEGGKHLFNRHRKQKGLHKKSQSFFVKRKKNSAQGEPF